MRELTKEIAQVERFFKEYIEEKWKPSVVPIEDEVQLDQKILVVLDEIGKRIVGDHFVLDNSNKEIFLNVARYFMGHDHKYPLNKGLLVWGKVGCGKTVLFQVIGIFLQIYNRRNGYRIEHCHDASHKFQMRGAEALEEFNDGSVCFDELGSEPLTTNHFGTAIPVMPMHIHSRYRLFTSKGRWTHFTSNFDLAWIEENYGRRESDRIKEMCTIIHMGGESRRR